MRSLICSVSVIVCGLSSSGLAATFGPDSVRGSTLAVQIDEVARVGTPAASNNFASPVVSHGDLYIVDQRGTLYRAEGAGFSPVVAAIPDELSPTGRTALTNVAAGVSEDELFVLYTSSTLPTGLMAAQLPTGVSGADVAGTPLADVYDWRGNGAVYHVLYRYAVSDAGLSAPEPISAYEIQSPGAHSGGGLVTLPNGRLLLATGDNLPWGYNGLEAAQDTASHVSKLLLIDPDTGATTVAAKGVRNTQSLWLRKDQGETTVVFADIGGVTAEEINAIPLADLTDTSTIENFGWGIADDGQAREGTFIVESGPARSSGTPTAVGEVDPDALSEAGFETPYAQFNRGTPGDAFAVSGVAFSDLSFDLIETLFADLASGSLFATTDRLTEDVVDVFEVTLFDNAMEETSLLDLSIRSRTDPRFFTFADGTAGVLIESTGVLYRLTEIAAPAVSLPASGTLLGACLFGLYGLRRRRL